MSAPRSLHSAFALIISSEIPLTELPAGDGLPDVEVTLGSVKGVPRTDAWTVIASPDNVRGWIPSGGAFQVHGGRTIVVDPIADADPRALRLAVVGPLLGAILAQRGCFVLHASTVAIDGEAVALVGPSGRGKSTLTAALTAAGHPLIADDLTVIDPSAVPPAVQPGFPRVKLWPDSASALDHDVDALPLIHPDQTKRSVQFPDNFHRERLPLARCYLLEDADEESSSVLAPSELVMALVASTYQATWLQGTGAAARNFAHCTQLARSGVVRRMGRRRSFDVLAEVIRFIENDVRSR